MLRVLGAIVILGAFPGTAAAQCPDGAPPPCRGATAQPPLTIAVLYFDNLSRDTADTYLADGFSEEVMSRLSQVERLLVKSRTAVQSVRGEAADPAALGRLLRVAHLVSGSVRRAAGRVRVTVELTRVASGNTMWSRSFDRSAGDIIGVEAEIAESVAVNVGARLAPDERRRIEARATRNAAAYDHLLRGRFAMSRRTTASLLASAREFEAAVRLDSTFVRAWTNLGNVLIILSNTYYSPEIGQSRETLRARGLAAVDRAIRIDSTSVDALIARAIADQGGRATRDLMTRAVALEPRNAEVHHYLGLAIRHGGDLEGSAAAFRRAVALEPDRVISLQNLGMALILLRRPLEAVSWFDSAVALRPDAAFFYSSAAFGKLLAGDTAGARALIPLITSRGGANAREEILATIEARAGDTASAQARMSAVDSAMRSRDCISSHECQELAFTLATVGLRDRALAVVERVRPRGEWFATWSTRPEFDLLRDEPRFRSVVDEARANAQR